LQFAGILPATPASCRPGGALPARRRLAGTRRHLAGTRRLASPPHEKGQRPGCAQDAREL
jgi:hypothetical protein